MDPAHPPLPGDGLPGLSPGEALPASYDELRGLARQVLHRWQGVQAVRPTSLVHEAWVRLANGAGATYHDREHFLAISARAMRCVLVDDARRRTALKRGGGKPPAELTEPAAALDLHASELLALDEALEQLAEVDPRKGRVVELRFFGGLSVEETAQALSLSTATVKREWRVAKAWLYRALSERAPPES